MGKKRGGGSHIPYTQAERKERTLLNEVERVRSTHTIPAYLSWCRRRCRQRGGLEFASVRAIVWRDLLLLSRPDTGACPTHGDGPAATTPTGSSSSLPVVPYQPEASGAPLDGSSTAIADRSRVRPSSSGAPPNCHEVVMDCDIQRSLWHLFPDEAVRLEKRAIVKGLLVRCLAHRPDLEYYQGLHEVVGFVVYIAGNHVPQETIVMMVDQLLSRHLHTFCQKDMKPCESLLYGLHHAVKQQRRDLGDMLETLQLGPGAHFALPWIITWFTHHLSETHPNALARIFDVLLSGTDDAGELTREDTVTVVDRNSTTNAATSPRLASNPLRPAAASPASSFSASVTSTTTSTIVRSISAASPHVSTLRGFVGNVVLKRLLRSSSPTSWSTVREASAAKKTLVAAGGAAVKRTTKVVERKFNGTMIGLLSAALLVYNADNILAIARAEIEEAHGDASAAFGRVFAALVQLPNTLVEEGGVLEDVIELAIRMTTHPLDGRLALLRSQARYCADHNVDSIDACVKAELAALGEGARGGTFRLSGVVVKAAVTTLLVATLAGTNLLSMSGEWTSV